LFHAGFFLFFSKFLVLKVSSYVSPFHPGAPSVLMAYSHSPFPNLSPPCNLSHPSLIGRPLALHPVETISDANVHFETVLGCLAPFSSSCLQVLSPPMAPAESCQFFLANLDPSSGHYSPSDEECHNVPCISLFPPFVFFLVVLPISPPGRTNQPEV